MRLHTFLGLIGISVFAVLGVGCSSSAQGPNGPGPALNAAATGTLRSTSGQTARRAPNVAACSGSGTFSFVGGAAGNVAGGTASGVLSGSNNQACGPGTGIGTGANNVITTSGSAPYNSFIGAGDSNTITGGGDDSFIGAGAGNTVSSRYAAIVGGEANQVTQPNGFVGSGEYNTASQFYAAVAGGYHNTASGEFAVVAGGEYNNASGAASAIPGGSSNAAAGADSFAAGNRSYAANPGTFVWSDDAPGAMQLKSTGNNQFLARASGGFTFWTNISNTVGAKLNPGSGTWASASDRATKTSVAPIDDAAVLHKVASMPISEWSYISERGVRHIGPMAQDFYSAFGVGEDNRHITSIDEDGVALAAIKGLHQENDGALETIRELRRQLSATNTRLARSDLAVRKLQARVSKLAEEMSRK